MPLDRQEVRNRVREAVDAARVRIAAREMAAERERNEARYRPSISEEAQRIASAIAAGIRQEPVPVPRAPRTRTTASTTPVEPAVALDIDEILARPVKKNFIYRVGVELEGGWTKVPEGVQLASDGSVQGLNLSLEEVTAKKRLKTGELQSEPMEIRKVAPWMEQSYPSHVNESCGLHVHVSFKSALFYMWLMTPQFPATVQEYLRRWGKEAGLKSSHRLFSRLRGENTYCRDEFHADGQASKTKKSYNHEGASRYTIINYPYGLHGTLECRVLPMFEDHVSGVKAVQAFIDITNACIQKTAQREEKHLADTKLTGTDNLALIEETIESV